jgi:hypothetical protein
MTVVICNGGLAIPGIVSLRDERLEVLAPLKTSLVLTCVLTHEDEALWLYSNRAGQGSPCRSLPEVFASLLLFEPLVLVAGDRGKQRVYGAADWQALCHSTPFWLQIARDEPKEALSTLSISSQLLGASASSEALDASDVEDGAEDLAEGIVEDVAEDVAEDIAEDIVEDIVEDDLEDIVEDIVEDIGEDIVEDDV